MADEAPQLAAAIQAQSADGMIHQFPAGTDPTVIDGVMKKYAEDNAPPKPAEPAEPVSGTLKGMGKAAGQEAITSAAQTISGIGAVTKGVGQVERAKEATALDLYNKVDAGDDIRALMQSTPSDLDRLALRQYQVATPDQRKEIRQTAMNAMAAPENQLELSGEHIQKAGEKLTDYAKTAIPLTPEEESRSTVIGTKMVVGLTKYIGAALAGGMPAVVGIAGVDAFGETYDKARLAGRTDAEATGDAMLNGLVQGGLMTVPIGQATKVFDTIPIALKGEFVKALAEAGKSGLTLVGFSQVATIADNVVAKSTYDPTRKPLEGVGEHLPETFVAGAVLPLAAAGMARVARGRTPAEVAKPVLDAPTVDDAIAKAKETIETPGFSVPGFDLKLDTAQAREFGGEGEQQQAKLNQLFGGLNEGEVRPTQDGGYAYARGDQEIPLNVWDEKAATGETGGTEAKPSPSTISPGLAAAQREHYQKLGIDVVYFDDPAAKVPFDGAVDPQNPNTVFLSNNPQRNAAQVGAHELTHVLESTTLPDGTSLADILHGQVRAGMTPEGLTHALDVFGKTAPERAAFPEGAGGDAAHGDAVIRHLVAELGADIGGEAPKFQTFIPKVVDEVRQRYGDDAAKGVVQKLIAGIQQAMRTLREFFFHPEEHAEYGQPETASQRWVTNLDEIHGTLVKMYAERFGTRAERENVALVDMRDRAQRDRLVKAPEAPATGGASSTRYEPGAEYEDARKKAETYRRWMGELERQGGSDADIAKVRTAFFNERRRMAEALSAQPAEQVGTGPQRRLEAPPAVTPPPGSKVTPENVFQPETYGAPRGSAPTAASSASAPAAKPATPERAEPHPVLPPAPSSAFDYKLAHEVETVWADKSIMGATHRGVARNEDFARDVARERLMREEAAPQVERAIKEDGLPEDRIPAVAKLFRPAEGESMEEAFNKAVDRYMTIEEAKGSQATLDPDVANYDMLKAEWATDPVLGEAFDRLDKHYAGENKGEIPGDEDIPFGTAETTPAQGAGQEAARGEAGRPEGQEAGGKPGVGREAPAQEEALAAPGGAAEPAKPQQAVEAPEGQPKAEATPAAKPATPPPIVAEPPKPKTSEMMQDAGEKIGGARKDRWAERGLRVADLEGMTEGEAFQHTTKDQVWPKPDYAKLVEGGMAPEAAARVKIIRDRLAAKPSKDSAEGRRQYIEMMGHVRDVLVNAKTADDVRTARDAIIYERAGVPREGRASPEAKAARELMFSVYKGRSEPFHLTYQDQRKAQQMVADGFPGKADPWTRRYMIRENSAGEFYVSAKTAYKQLSSYFKDRTDAETAARDLYDKEGGKAAEAPVPKRPHLDEIKRTGADVRGGKDVTGDDFVKDFGFRGVEFGNWVASDERQKSVNLAYDALHDMAGVIGVPPEALSLDGKLGLAFGARGSGQFAAHYEPGRLVINLTKLSGAGSLAHEWAHALDHYFGELDREGGTRGEARGASGWYTKTDQRTSYLGNLRAEMAQAFDRVMDVIFKREKPRAEAVRDAELRLETIQAGIDGYRERAEKSTDAGFKKQVDDYIARQTLQLDAAGRRLATLRDEAQPYTGQKVTSSYYQEANKLSGKSGEQGYWSRPTEMFARAFESFVFDKIKEAGNKSDYLVQGVEAARYAKGYKGNPYPAAERPAINAAFQHLFDTMETREGEGGRRVLFSPRGENEPKGPTLLDTREATPEELAARQRVRDKEEAEARMRGRKGGKVPQESADETPLFGGPRQSTLFSPRDERPFYSALTRGVEGLKLEKGTPGQWEATVRNMPGVKAEERAWVGLEDWLRQQTKSVTKAEVLGYLREHEVKVSEVQRGGGVPESAVKALEDWIDKEYGKAEPGDQNADIAPGTWEGLRRGDAEAISNVEAWGAPDHLMKPIYDSIGGGATKFGSYVLPGGKNYKELLLTLPTKSQFDVRNAEGRYRLFDNKANDWVRTPDGKLRTGYDSQADAQRAAQGLNETAGSNPMGNFRGGHWDEPNVLAHARFDDRTGPNGEKVLHLAEVQSDWHQKGRKQGYVAGEHAVGDKFTVVRGGVSEEVTAVETHPNGVTTVERPNGDRFSVTRGEGVPDAPFKTSWPELAMKRVLRYAADNGYDRLSWDTGDTNAARYDLSKQVDSVDVNPRTDARTGERTRAVSIHLGDRQGTIELGVDKNGVVDNSPNRADMVGKRLDDVVGKEIAEKIMADDHQTIWGDDLKVGGEGMKAFYDKQLPVIANKIGKRFGAKVEDTNINGEHPGPMRVASNGTDYWLERSRDGSRVSGNFDSAAAAMDAREAKFHGPDAHSIEITPAMREGVMQGQPLFSPKREAPLAPEERAAYDRVFAKAEPFSLKKWFDDAKADLGKKAIAAALDPYIAVKESDPQGYMALRLANTTAGANEVFRRFGTVKFEGSTFALDTRNGGAENNVVRPLAGEAGRFIKWVAANRAEQLSKEGRENLFSDQDIATIKKTNQGTVDFDYTLSNGKTTRSREAIFLDSLAKYDVFNKNVLDAELGSGLISKETYDTLRQNKFYVPFLREASETDKGFTGPNASAGFVKQQAFKKLKGGTEKLNDLWDNAFANWQHGIDASLSNRAAAQVLDTAANSALPSARRMTLQEVKYLSDKELKARTTWVMENGKQVHYEITDPLLFKAVSAAEPLGDALGLLTAGRFFKRALQVGVTMNPMFAVRNLIRDTQQTLATAPQNINIAKNLADGFKMNDMGGALGNIARASAGRELRDMALSDEAVNAIAGGATMRLAAGSDTGIRDTKISSMLNTPEKLQGFMGYLSKLGGAYRGAMEQGEDVNRMSLYRNLRAQGVPHDAASFAARDLADFTLSGASTAVRVIVATVPFLNARLQGLYKVGRSLGNADQAMGAAVGLPNKSSTARAATVLGVTALAVLALDQIYANDEDYKKRTDYDRDTYYWFKFGDTQVRIPMGFEIATLSRMAANTAEVFFDKEMTGRRLAESTWSMIGTNLQMNPIPQALKPIYDIATNIGGTGRHIEPKGMEDLPPEQRYTVNNTLAARGASSMINSVLRAVPGLDSAGPSPIQIDYLVNAYGGWLATTSLGMADTAARSMTSEPARPAKDMWAAATQGMISSEPSPQSRYVEMLYRQGTQVEQAYAAYRDKLQRGLAKEAQQYLLDNKDLIQKHGLVSSVMRLEGNLNKQIRMITNNPDPAVTPEQKRIQIMRLQAIQSRSAEQVFGAPR